MGMNIEGWSKANIPDLVGVTAVVTGANREGIGLEVAGGLAAKVVLAVRHTERGDAAAAATRATSPGASLEVMALDLADLASVRRFAAAVRSRWDGLDLLINKAGVGSASLQHTADGYELVFGTNHPGHFALTGLVLPTLLATPKARVVTVASLAHARGQIDAGNLDAAKSYSNARAYAQSKLANLLFAYELQRRLSEAGAGLLSVAAHAGWAATNTNIRPLGERSHRLDRLVNVLTRWQPPRPRASGRSCSRQPHRMCGAGTTSGRPGGPRWRAGPPGSGRVRPATTRNLRAASGRCQKK